MITVKGKYNVALDDMGLVLQGTPDEIGYAADPAPAYENRFAQGDRAYGDFSFWWFWAQTDWFNGMKSDPAWADDGKFYEMEGVTTYEKAGSVLLNWRLLNSVSYAKDVTWYDFGDAYGTTIALGRNNTDGKMLSINTYDGSLIWQDTATGANEEIRCGASLDGGELYIGCHTVGSGSSMFKKGTGGSFSDVGTHNTGAGIYGIVPYPDGDCFYLFTYNGGLYHVARGGTTFTQKKTAYPYGQTFSQVQFCKNALIGDRIYFIMPEINSYASQLWCYDISADSWVFVWRWGQGYNPNKYVARGTNLYCFDTNNVSDRIQIWKYDTVTGTMTRISEVGRAGTISRIVGNPALDAENIFFIVDDNTSDYQIYQLDPNDALTGVITPPAAFATASSANLYIKNTGLLLISKNGADGVNKIDGYDQSPVNDRQTTGYIKTSIYDAEIPSIEKLWYSVTIGFDKFTSSQGIEVLYSLDNGATFTSLGSASYTLDGSTTTTKTFYFGANVKSRKLMLKFILTGAGNQYTPSLNDYAVKFLPIIAIDKQWRINIDCGDEVTLLDGSKETRQGREIKAKLETAWINSKIVDWQDVDYAATALAAQLAAGATTATVDDTSDFPSAGRLRIDDEVIFYTGKTPTTFTGLLRGQKGTKDVVHNDDSVVHNGYKVFISQMSARIPIINREKKLEYVVGLLLRETN